MEPGPGADSTHRAAASGRLEKISAPNFRFRTPGLMIGQSSGEAAGMRFLLGVIIGALLTMGTAYIVDSRADPLQGTRMVNWDVVGERVSELTADLRVIWDDFTRQITGPP